MKRGSPAYRSPYADFCPPIGEKSALEPQARWLLDRLRVAMAATLAYAANLIGPPIFGAVASAAGLRVAFAMLAPAAIAIAALGYRLRRKRAGRD
jgi:hypothetical protein